MIYVEFPGGTRYPDGYIVQAEVIKRIPGWVKVLLTGAPPRHRFDWAQWVRESQTLREEEVEEAP